MEISCFKKINSSKVEVPIIDDYKNKDALYQSLLKKFVSIEKDFFNDLNSDLHSKVVNFLRISYNKWKMVVDQEQNIIDVGILLLGVNTSDHSNTISYLENAICQSSHCSVIKLTSENSKTIKKVMEIICNSIIYKEDKIKLPIPLSLKYSVYALKIWAQQKKNLEKEQFVLILEDIESFNSQLLQNIIEIIGTLLPIYPFVMLFGVSSSMESVNEMLTIRCLSRLSLEIFRTPKPATLLNNFVTKFTNAALPFQLSHRVFAYIANRMFMSLDYSTENLIARYKYCLLEHVMHNCTVVRLISPELDLCSPVIKAHISHLKLINKLIHWLLELFSDFKVTNLGSQFYQLFCVQLQQSIGDSEHLKLTLDRFRSFTNEEIAQSICRANSHYIATQESHPIVLELMETSKKFATDILSGFTDDDLHKSVPIVGNNSITRKPSQSRQYQKELLKTISENKSKKKVSPVENFCDWIRSWFSKNLPHYSTLEGYEAVYYDDLVRFQENVNPSIKSTIERALANPYSYVKNDKMRIDNLSSVTEFMPDTCIIYKLSQESARLLNLYDLLEAFATIINEDISKNPPSLKTQCRFMQSIAELQFLGILKGNNNSKSDHATKLTWPGLF